MTDADSDLLLLDELLTACAVEITGDPAVEPRPGQVAFAHDMTSCMHNVAQQRETGLDCGSTRLLAEAPTGLGKSLGYGLPAMLAAAVHGHRTLISTGSKGLQDQLIDKDLSLIAKVVERRTGVAVRFAIHKGFQNYLCPLATVAAASELLGCDDSLVHSGKGLELSPAEVAANAASLSSLADDLDELAHSSRARRGAVVEGVDVTVGEFCDVASWGLQAAADGAPADRSTYPEPVSEASWRLVSVGPTECVGKKCPLASVCPARLARAEAAEADVVVANHSLLGIQAATGQPIVLGSSTLGDFDHLVVDECHELPAAVRSAGQCSLNAPRVRGLTKQVKSLGGLQGLSDTQARELARDGRAVADRMEQVLDRLTMTNRPVTFDPDAHPLGSVADDLTNWVGRCLQSLPKPSRATSVSDRVKLVRVRDALQAVVSELGDATNPASRLARWVEADQRPGGARVSSVKHSPVDVGAAMAFNLYQAPAPEPELEREERLRQGLPRLDAPMVPVSVTMCSATVPMGFSRDASLGVQGREYPSPLASAFDASLLYIPTVTDPFELAQVAVWNDYNGRWKFDVDLFAGWAAQRVVQLVRANNGSALVLAARAKDGKLYAQALRDAGLGFEVLSQWDGVDSRRLVDQWRSDTSSVLVGTRSVMTGVDGAGDTNTLVIIDRPSRAPQNVVDDARCALLCDPARPRPMDNWSAQLAVYVSDAELLLEQAAGRGVRRPSDHVLMVCLDPRLMKDVPLSYPEQTRQAYMRAFRRFHHRTRLEQRAFEFLTAQALPLPLAS